ncbi:sucrose utilization protein-like protein [Emericellopsis cladophorae]|uniref:Sucrose utilization protein-like protein n=1 Tax=Emericellopsis cladophorae TaxID=2686198 RepID=A0A9Q0B8U2_9HYPO|nr:sucrose utilization protein-like protein [Emericellopsis cladophorae]KAI6778127.1 sucrose utilization protein-like protein [Emericellopsis cladophorae]
MSFPNFEQPYPQPTSQTVLPQIQDGPSRVSGTKRSALGSFGDSTHARHSLTSAESPSVSIASSASPANVLPNGSAAENQYTSGNASGSPATKRFQVPRACERCKRLRRGCSEYRPCRRCVDAGVADQCQVMAVGPQMNGPGTGNDAQSLHQRLSDLVPARLVDYCTQRFFDRLHPTIPILTMEYVARLRAASISPGGLESLAVLVGMCGQVLLQTEEPEELFQQGVIPEKNLAFGRLLLDTAIAAYQGMPRRSVVSIEVCMFSFFLYACEAVLFHHSRAFRFLRETTTLVLLFRPEEADDTTQLVANRLFWVLLISERSHAIRYRRPITLQITNATPSIDAGDSSLVGFWSLAALFRPIDTSFIALLNHEELAIGPSPESINHIETKVNSALSPGLDLRDTQKANLRVTQLWLRVIIWQLRLHLGYLVEESYQHSLTYRYPIDVAKDLMLSTRDLSPPAFKVHGVGLTEKLFDIASALVDVLARIPLSSTSPRGVAMGTLPEDDLLYLRNLIRKLPGGQTMFDDLLEKHIQQSVPALVTWRPDISSSSTLDARGQLGTRGGH